MEKYQVDEPIMGYLILFTFLHLVVYFIQCIEKSILCWELLQVVGEIDVSVGREA